MENLTWVSTDSDNSQYSREIRNGVFEFKEFDRNNYSVVGETYEEKSRFIDSIFDDSEFWVEITVDISKLTEKEKNDAISGYYSSLAEVSEIYGEEANLIIAECYFEQESGLY